MEESYSGLIVSIVVPVYNAEKYLPRCIESILSQSYNNIELILVDDCSIDSSMEISKAYQIKDNRIRILRNAYNVGPMRARDNGRIEAKGEWIAFIDADDWLPVDSIEKMLNAANNSQADVVCGVMVGLSDKGGILSKFSNTLPYGSSSDGIAEALIHDNLRHNLAGKLFKKKIFECDLKIYNNDTNAEDGLVFYQIVENIKRIVLIEDDVYYYSQGTSATPRGRKLNDKQLRNIGLFWSYLVEDFIKKHPKLKALVFERVFFEIIELLKQGVSKKRIISNIKADIVFDEIYNSSYILKKSHGIKKLLNYLLFNSVRFCALYSHILIIKNKM